MAFGAVYGPPFVREGDVRRDGTMEDFRNFARLAQTLRRPRLGRRRGQRAQRHAARQPAPRHDLRAADADRQVLHGQRRLRRPTPRDTIAMTEILFGSREAIEETPAIISLINCNSPAALGRPDARVAVRVLRRQPAGRPDAVHPDGRDVAGDDPGRAGPADHRGAVRDRALAADPARLPGGLRLVPVQHRHAVRARRRSARRSRASGCCAPGRSRATSTCRSAPAAGSPPRRCPTRRPATRR